MATGEAPAELSVFSRETLFGALANDLNISDFSLFKLGAFVVVFFCWELRWGVSSFGFASIRPTALPSGAFGSRAWLGSVSAFTAGFKALGAMAPLLATGIDCAGEGLEPVLRCGKITSGIYFGCGLVWPTLTRAFWIVPY